MVVTKVISPDVVEMIGCEALPDPPMRTKVPVLISIFPVPSARISTFELAEVPPSSVHVTGEVMAMLPLCAWIDAGWVCALVPKTT